jgi:hypothetical protein
VKWLLKIRGKNHIPAVFAEIVNGIDQNL